MERTRLPEDIQALNAQLRADPALTENMGPVHLQLTRRSPGLP